MKNITKWLVQLVFKFDDEEYAEVSMIRKEVVDRYRKHPFFVVGMLLVFVPFFYIIFTHTGPVKYLLLPIVLGLGAMIDTITAEYCRKVLELKKSMVQK